ncbi:MAG: DUF5667 domain-containing protein [Ardenticatenaceae bacterium]|nr:DUF5667 domain-containing protein [Ardenticatenaceae bacterium]
MAQPDITLILDMCIERIRGGDTVENCLSAYPAEAAELRPILQLSADLEQLPALEPAVEMTSRHFEIMMAAFDDQSANDRSPGWLSFLNGWGWFSSVPTARRTLRGRLAQGFAVMAMVIVVSGSLVASAAAGSLPGEPFYPVKRTIEETRLSLTFDEDGRSALAERFNQARLAEIEALQTAGRSAKVEFQGVIEEKEAGVWVLSGLAVEVTEEAQVEQTLEPGQTVAVTVEVKRDGSIIAVEIMGPPENSGPLLPVTSATPTRTVEATRPAEETPTRRPTARPTATPSATVETRPTAEPTIKATATAQITRDVTPTPRPTDKVTPTKRPDDVPSPTAQYTPAPVGTPVVEPTRVPTEPPATRPSDQLPSPTPNLAPTNPANVRPTETPQRNPTATPKPNDKPPTPTPVRDGSNSGGGNQPP